MVAVVGGSDDHGDGKPSLSLEKKSPTLLRFAHSQVEGLLCGVSVAISHLTAPGLFLIARASIELEQYCSLPEFTNGILKMRWLLFVACALDYSVCKNEEKEQTVSFDKVLRLGHSWTRGSHSDVREATPQNRCILRTARDRLLVYINKLRYLEPSSLDRFSLTPMKNP